MTLTYSRDSASRPLLVLETLLNEIRCTLLEKDGNLISQKKNFGLTKIEKPVLAVLEGSSQGSGN